MCQDLDELLVQCCLYRLQKFDLCFCLEPVVFDSDEKRRGFRDRMPIVLTTFDEFVSISKRSQTDCAKFDKPVTTLIIRPLLPVVTPLINVRTYLRHWSANAESARPVPSYMFSVTSVCAVHNRYGECPIQVPRKLNVSAEVLSVVGSRDLSI